MGQGPTAEYMKRRDKYLEKYAKGARSEALHRALKRLEGLFTLTVTNDSDHTLTDLRVSFDAPQEVLAFENSSEIEGGLPTAPKLNDYMGIMDLPLGQQQFRAGIPQIPTFSTTEIDNRRSITLHIESLHAHRSATTNPFILLTNTESVPPEDTQEKRWEVVLTATAANRSGQLTTSREVETTSAIWKMTQLLAL